MEISSETGAARGPILVAFRCPFCVAEQAISLVALARAGGSACPGCHRRLSRGEVSEAIARTRRRPGDAPPPRRGSRIYP